VITISQDKYLRMIDDGNIDLATAGAKYKNKGFHAAETME
jgi:hypothetical protein